MSTENKPVEQQILIAVRKTLSKVVKDTTTPPGMQHPLTESTINDIRHCFALITAREHELTEQSGGTSSAKPRYIDEKSDKQVVQFIKPEKK